MRQNNEFLGTAKIGPLLFKLALPTVVAQVINMLYNMVDRIYIGHIPETGMYALTGLGVCFPIIMIVSAFASLIGSGGAPRASIELGRKNNDKAQLILGNCFTALVVVSLVLTVVIVIWNRPILLAFGASSNTIEYATRYMRIYALGSPFVLLTLGLNMFITAQGFTTISMISVLIGAVLNIFLDPILIFSCHMGVSGAALATIISQFVSMVWVIWFLASKKTIIRLKLSCFRIRGKILWSAISLGLATFIMQSSESIIFVCYNSSLLKYGGDLAVGAMTILTSVMQFVSMPTQGIGQGAQPIISYNYGAGQTDRVKKTFWTLLAIDLAFTMVMWFLCMFCSAPIVSLFTSDPALKEFSAEVLKVYMSVMGIFGIQMACQMTFTSIGEALSAILVAMMRKFVLIIPLIYILPAIMKNNQLISVYMSEPVADLISVIFCSVLFFFQFRRKLKLIEK